MRGGNRLERRDSLLARFTDADQQSGGEGNLQFPGEAQRVESTLRILVGGQSVGREVGESLKHHSLRGRHRTKLREFMAIKCSRIGVRE